MAQIPMDIVREILLRLPAESLLRTRAVCREWCNIIDDKSFINSHNIRSQLSPTTLLIRTSSNNRLYFISFDSLINCADHDQEILEAMCVQDFSRSGLSGISFFPLPSCNGLILLRPPDSEKNWVIFNPSTRKFQQLPPLKGLVGYAQLGFGYDSSSDDYKVVVIGGYPRRRNGDPYYSFVYSMKADSWRKIADVDPADVIPYRRDGVFVDGFLHWKFKKDSLTRLDLATEFYDKVPLPKTEREVSFWDFSLLNGCIGVTLYYKAREGLEGWVMKEGGWMKLFSIAKNIGFMMPIAYLKRKGLVLLTHWCSQGSPSLYWLDIGKNSLRMVCFQGLPEYISPIMCFSESLVQLDQSYDARLDLSDSIPSIHLNFILKSYNYLFAPRA